MIIKATDKQFNELSNVRERVLWLRINDPDEREINILRVMQDIYLTRLREKESFRLKEYCIANGLHYNTIYAWQLKYGYYLEDHNYSDLAELIDIYDTGWGKEEVDHYMKNTRKPKEHDPNLDEPLEKPVAHPSPSEKIRATKTTKKPEPEPELEDDQDDALVDDEAYEEILEKESARKTKKSGNSIYNEATSSLAKKREQESVYMDVDDEIPEVSDGSVPDWNEDVDRENPDEGSEVNGLTILLVAGGIFASGLLLYLFLKKRKTTETKIPDEYNVQYGTQPIPEKKQSASYPKVEFSKEEEYRSPYSEKLQEIIPQGKDVPRDLSELLRR